MRRDRLIYALLFLAVGLLILAIHYSEQVARFLPIITRPTDSVFPPN